MYARVFEDHHEGREILEDLIKRFGRPPYVRGALEAERQTLVNLGAKYVLDFIVMKINQAHGVQDHADIQSSTDGSSAS